jgi:pimeloyl-ACP methyl ester carboxylesterase
MKFFHPFELKSYIAWNLMKISCMACVLFLLTGCSTGLGQYRKEEITFQSADFTLVGDLLLPEGEGPHPVILFVHGDGPNNRTSGVTYPPIMKRMLGAGYATFAWDKPGTGASTGEIDRKRLVEQRAQIVLDAIEVMKEREDIDTMMIGLWGISQAGYVMPRVLEVSDDIAFMIAVSCPGEPGVEQGIYLVTAQAVCAGLPEEDRAPVESLFSGAARARTYEEHVRFKSRLKDYPELAVMSEYGVNIDVRPEDEWHADDPEGPYFWDPIEIIERTTIPVLAFFGGKDTQVDPIQGVQAYTEALTRAGNPFFRVELIPNTDHNIIISETGSLLERERRSRAGWTNYAPEYLDILTEWLTELRTHEN